MVPGDGPRHAVQEFHAQVQGWLEGLSASRPDLQERARLLSDPAIDPWGYLASLGELIVFEG